MKLNDYKTDATKENGVWVKFDDEGCEFFLASRNRDAFNKAYEKAIKAATGFKRNAADTHGKALKAAIAETCVLGWKNVSVDGKEPLEFSRAAVDTVLAVQAVYDWIIVQVSELSNFQAEATAEDAAELKSGS